MPDIIFRMAASSDMGSIFRLLETIFKGEQEIPTELIPVEKEKSPQWWCAADGDTIIGAVAAWLEGDQAHWGRFAVNTDYRGRHLGLRLARFSLEALFSQNIETIYIDARDVTVKLICNMGGKVVGEPFDFYEGKVTPVVLHKKDYICR